MLSNLYFSSQRFHEILYRDAFLFHRVAVADSDHLVFDRLEVVCYAVRRSYLVLTAVALTYRTGFVVIDHEFLCEHVVDFTRAFAKLLRERKHRALERREGG